MGGPAETAHRPELRQRATEVAEAVGHHAERLAGGRHASRPSDRGLRVRQGHLEVVRLEEDRHHDQVPGDALGVLLRQGAQLLVHRPVELLAGHLVRDARLRKPGALRRQSGRPALLLLGPRPHAATGRPAAHRGPPGGPTRPPVRAPCPPRGPAPRGPPGRLGCRSPPGRPPRLGRCWSSGTSGSSRRRHRPAVSLRAATRPGRNPWPAATFIWDMRKGPSRTTGPFWKVCPAASYSPTPSPVQYHRR